VDLKSLTIERSPKSAPRRSRNPWPLRAGLALLAGAAGWLFWPQLTAFFDRVRLPTVKTFAVTTSAPAAAAASRGTAANGYVIAARRAALSSDVPGRIVEMLVREGSVVQKGDVVARLFADEYAAGLLRATADETTAAAAEQRAVANLAAARAAVTEAEAAVVTATAQRDEAEAQLAWAGSEVERTTELLRQGVGNERDATRARTERDAASARSRAAAAAIASTELAAASARQRLVVADADVVVAQAQRQAAAASRQLAQATFDKTFVRAPFDGVVVLKDAEVGEVVSPNSQGGSTARGAVCTMVDFASLEIQANVPETTLGAVQVGAPADVFLDAYQDDRLTGKVDRIWPTADRQKATVEVRIKLDAADERLRPEMGVRIVFRSGDAPAADAVPAAGTILLPENAVVAVDGARGTFVLERDVVQFRALTLGAVRNGRVVVAAGLAAGTRVVLDPPPTLRSGDRVQLAPQ
jgi:RND family efflux transporter MFP subunit